MEKNKKSTTGLDFKKFKEVLNDIGKGLVTFIKNVIIYLKKFFRFLASKKIGKLNGVHIFSIAIVVVLFVILLMGNGEKEIAYPLIYNNNDGDLYLVDTSIKSGTDAIKLASGESTSNVVYANTTERYVLFKKNNSAYLYDAKKSEETLKIAKDVVDYFFSLNDKYIVTLDDAGNLDVYNYKDTEKIEKDVSSIVDYTEDKIMYVKESILYVRSINPNKDDRLKVTENYDSYVRFSEDGKNIIYLDTDRNLHLFNIKKDKDEKIASKVSSCYCDDSSCEKMFYVENDDSRTIYYYDGKESNAMADDIYSVNAYDVEHKQIVFTKVVDDKYSLYFQKYGKDEVEIEDNITGLRTVKLFEGKDIYYINSDNELNYVRISGSDVSSVKNIGNDVTGYLFVYKKGYVFVGDVKNSSGTLYKADRGNVKKIDTEVNCSLVTVGNDGKDIYYLKDYQTTGDLYIYNGMSKKEIAKDVYNYEYVKDNLIYFIKDYSVSKARGDLYRYTNKAVLIESDITRVASSPVYFELK